MTQPTVANLVLRGATVVDTADGSLKRGRDVLIAGDRIIGVGPKSATTLPEGTQIVDAAGTFVVPGFNDMHAHPMGETNPQASYDLLLAHGVTGFRQMNGSAALLAARRTLGAEAPRLLCSAGDLLNPLNARTGADGVTAVRKCLDEGADFVKVGLVTPEVFFDVQAEANKRGLPVAGHLPAGIDVERASGEGMRAIEHLGPGVSLLGCCSSHADAIAAEVAAKPAMKQPPVKLPFLETLLMKVLKKIVINPVNLNKKIDIDTLQHASSTFDEDAAAAIAKVFVANGTWQVPTLIRSKATYLCNDDEFAQDPDLRYVSAGTLKGWQKATAKHAKFPAQSQQTFRLVYATMLQLTRVLDDAGVKMLAGSDAGGAGWELPGASLHKEFDELARAGLSPLRVLQMTTSDPAEFIGATADSGSVAVGKYADLVLLDANPVESVDNLHRISGVVRGGRYLSAADLTALKDRVAAARSI